MLRAALFHTDAVQAAGHVRLDAEALGVDMLSISAHKFHGPKGSWRVGMPYGARAPSLSCMAAVKSVAVVRARENVPGIVGLAVALEEACETVEENATRVRGLRNRLEEQLEQIEGAYVVGKAAPRVPGISNVCFEGLDHQVLIPLLDARGVCVSAGSACSRAR